MALSRVVSKIFSVEKCRDLEIGVKGHSRLSKLTRNIVNILCVLTMVGRLRWLWLSGSPPLIFLLSVLLFVESVYGK